MNKDVNPFKNNGYKQPASIAVMALLIFGVVAVVMASSPRSAFAAVDISSSSTRFYGPALERVLITDTSKDTSTDTINPHIDVKRGSSILGSADPSIGIIGSSGAFEFFLTTADRGFTPLHPTQTDGFPFVIRISSTPSVNSTTSGSPAAVHEFGIDIGAQAPLKDGDTIVITYGGQTKTIQFAKTNVVAGLDRTVAGLDNLVTLTLTDQDANIDPTSIDSFTATSNIVTAAGGTMNFTGASFIENGQNSGAFDLVVQIGGSSNPTNGARVTGVTFPSSASFTLNDRDVYSNTPASATAPYDAVIENGAVTSSKSLTLRNTDGILTLTSPVSIGNGINLQINDPDRNIDTKTRDTMTGQLTITLNTTAGVAIGTSYSTAPFKETDFNSGLFLPDLTDNSIPITLTSGASTVDSTGIFVNAATLADDPDLHITYSDPAADPTGAKTFKITTKILHVTGAISAPTTAITPNGKFSLTIADNDLNTNTDSADSFVVTFTSTSTTENTFVSGLGGLTIKAKGGSIPFTGGSSLTMSFIETGDNTGIFTASSIDMQKINALVPLKDGDQLEFKYFDHSESPVQTSTVTITVGKPPVNIDTDRTTVPIPINGGVKFTITVTDQSLDTNPSSTDSVSLGHNLPTTNNDLEAVVTKKDGTVLTTSIGGLTTGADLNAATFTETGPTTGVFTHQFTLTGTGADESDLDNAKIKFTYTSSSGTTTSISVTTKSFDGAVSASSTVVKAGDNVTITVSDPDLNLDSTTAEQTSIDLTVTNDDVDQGSGSNTVTISDLKETGPNTGVFTKAVSIGKDVKIGSLTDNNFGTTIEIHYNDELANDVGSANVDRELDLRIGSGTGIIVVTPDVVGPGTKVSIDVVDTDLNTNPQGVDTTQSSEDYLKITSNATNANTLSTATGEETGTNTGTFHTKLTLSPRPVTNTGKLFDGTGKEITGKVLPGDVVSVRYTDQKDAQGNKITVSKTFMVVSVNPEMKIDKDTVTAGDSFTLTVADTDANTDGDAVDTITVRVTSTSDPVGITTTALETGANTGVFTVSIPTTTGVTTGSVSVKKGDSLTVKYTDNYPADYASRVRNVADPSKDFYFNVQIGGSLGGVTSTTPSQSVPSDLSGNPVSEVKAGQQVLLRSNIVNNEDSSRTFTAVIQTEDANGIVVALGIVSGEITANGQTSVGSAFTPDVSGNYTVKVFVLSNLSNNPTILATPSNTTLNVR
jgi:hypothetical protein